MEVADRSRDRRCSRTQPPPIRGAGHAVTGTRRIDLRQPRTGMLTRQQLRERDLVEGGIGEVVIAIREDVVENAAEHVGWSRARYARSPRDPISSIWRRAMARTGPWHQGPQTLSTCPRQATLTGSSTRQRKPAMSARERKPPLPGHEIRHGGGDIPFVESPAHGGDAVFPRAGGGLLLLNTDRRAYAPDRSGRRAAPGRGTSPPGRKIAADEGQRA